MPAEPSIRRRVLFVDDDPEFLQMIERVMRLWSKDEWDILSASSASAALAILQDQALNLVVIDVCMPVVDGLQFLSIVHRRFPELHKVVLTGYASEAYRTACLSNGAELFLEKPRTADGMESIFATLNELTRWKSEPGFRGVLRRVGLMDVIQMECLNQNSTILAITAPNGSGSIFIRGGSIIHAENGEIKGEDALYRLLNLVSGDFRLNPFSEPPEQTITAQWEGLLMDAAQRKDESAESVATEAAKATVAEKSAVAAQSLSEQAQALPIPSRIKIEELMICSEGGDVLQAWGCPNTELRINFLEFISQKARLLQNALPLGIFDRVEFKGNDGRLVAQIGQERGIILRTSADSPAAAQEESARAKTRQSIAPPSSVRKSQVQQWFLGHLDLAGLLAAGLQFSDRSGCSHSLSPNFVPDALETLRRCVSDSFQVLNLQRFQANRSRWTCDQTAIECAQWPDGTCLALVLSRQTLDLDVRALDQRIEEFLAESDLAR